MKSEYIAAVSIQHKLTVQLVCKCQWIGKKCVNICKERKTNYIGDRLVHVNFIKIYLRDIKTRPRLSES